jgi:hypothetical protein
MSKTEVSGKQLKDGSVELVDLAPEVSGVLDTLQSDVATLQTDVAAKADAGNLASVATSGSYNDLSDKPSIPSVVGLASETYVDTAVAGKADSASLASVATSGSYTDLTNKPSLFSGDYGDLANKPTIPSVVGLASETYVDTAVAGVVNSAPAVLDTLNELSAALGNDENFATTVAGQIGDVASDVSGLDTRVTALEGDIGTLQSASAPNLSDLGEVAITTPSSGQVLKYDGLGWVNAADSTFSGVYADLTSKPTLFDGAYASLTGAPTLATVATSGSYNDLTNKPAAGASDLDGLSDVVITSAAKGHFIAHNGTNFVNTRTIEANVAATTPLSLKGAASQSAPIFEVLNSAGTQTMRIAQDGKMRILQPTGASGTYINVSNQWDESIFSVSNDSTGGWISIGTQIYFTSTFGFNKTHRCFGIVPSQERLFFTESLDNGAGKYTLAIDRDTGKSCWAFSVGGTGHGFNFVTANGSAGVGIDLTAAPAAKFQVNSTAAARKGVIVKGAASQTANLFEAQNSAGTSLVAIDSSGKIGVATTPIMMLDVQSAGEFTVGGGNFKAVAQFQKSTGNRPGVICGYDNSGNGAAIIGAAANTIGTPITFWTYNNTAWGERVRIAESGYLGVNTTSPTAHLDVAGNCHAKRYTETVANAFNTSLAPSTGTLTVDTSLGNAVLGALSAAVTTWAFTNVPTDNSKVTTVTAVLAGNASYTYGDACSVNGSAVSGGIMWSGGSAPTATAGTDIITFVIVKDSAGTVKVFGSATTNFS